MAPVSFAANHIEDAGRRDLAHDLGYEKRGMGVVSDGLSTMHFRGEARSPFPHGHHHRIVQGVTAAQTPTGSRTMIETCYPCTFRPTASSCTASKADLIAHHRQLLRGCERRPHSLRAPPQEPGMRTMSSERLLEPGLALLPQKGRASPLVAVFALASAGASLALSRASASSGESTCAPMESSSSTPQTPPPQQPL